MKSSDLQEVVKSGEARRESNGQDMQFDDTEKDCDKSVYEQKLSGLYENQLFALVENSQLDYQRKMSIMSRLTTNNI